MQCVNPYYLKQFKIFVPCYHCIACRMSYSREWSTRLLHEASYYTDNCFLTFTYSDKYLPLNKSLDKAVLQRLIKRLRKFISPVRIKYFGCGEYGDENDRPHYHLIVIGWKPHRKSLSVADYKNGKPIYQSVSLQKIWTYGYNTVGTVTYDSCRYVCDYIMKKYDNEKAKEVYGDRLVPFRLMSNGLGKRYAQDNAERLHNQLKDTVRGVPIGLPRYYRQVLGIEGAELAERAQAKLKEVKEHYDIRGSQVLAASNLSSRQRERNLKARTSLRKKGQF